MKLIARKEPGYHYEFMMLLRRRFWNDNSTHANETTESLDLEQQQGT